jgi:hypothetical protein
MRSFCRLTAILGCFSAVHGIARALAPSDTYQDADIGQSGYVGGDHNIDPESLSQFKELWNVTFTPDEKVCSCRNYPYAALANQRYHPALRETISLYPPIRAPDRLHSLDREYHPHNRRSNRRAHQRAPSRKAIAMASGRSELLHHEQKHGHHGDADDISGLRRCVLLCEVVYRVSSHTCINALDVDGL